MADLDYYRRQGAEVARRLKKAELVDYFARALAAQAVDADVLKSRVEVLEREASGDEPKVLSPDDTRVKGVSLDKGGETFMSAPTLAEVDGSYAMMVRLLGEPNAEDAANQYRTVAWAIYYKGERFTVADYRPDCSDPPDVGALRKASTVKWIVIGTYRCKREAVDLCALLKHALATFNGDLLLPTRIERAVEAARTLARSDAMREALDNVAEAAEQLAEKASDLREKLAETEKELQESEDRFTAEDKASDKRIADLDASLCDALADRAALLKRLGLSDREWSAMGGACEADFEV